MSRYAKILAALGGLLAFVTVQADVSLGAARVGAKDVAALASFYQAAFGMQEITRLQVGPNIEIILNFGATVDAAKANTPSQILVMHRESDDLVDPVPHLILYVSDMTATVAAVKAAGGKLRGEPIKYGNAGTLICLGSDPVGNGFELIQRPKPQ